MKTEPRISEDHFLKKMSYPSHLGNRFGSSYQILLDDQYVFNSNVEKERNFVDEGEEELKQE